MNVKLITISFLLIGFVAACDKKSENPAPAAMPPMPVSVITAEPTSVPISVEAVAQTEGASEVEVRPRVGGIILKKMFEEGAAVKAGQLMFLIDPDPFQIALAQAKAAAAGQGARITQTSRESARLKDLLATQSISQREYDNATSDASISQAGMMQAQANIKEAELNLSYTRVTAPVSGMAGRFQFSEGALVQAGTSLLTTIVQTSPIWVRFSLSDSELASLGGQMSNGVAKEISLILPDGSEYAQKGKLNFMSSEINPNLGTQELRATFDNKDKKLMPGQFVRARVTTGSQEGVFLVPQAAVSTGEQGTFVFIANDKNQAERRTVKVGEWKGTDWIILSGLNAGDKVITDNLIKLNMMPPGAQVAPHAPGAAPSLPVGASSAKPEDKK
ncbi:MAG: efflux RND transporter periplasmic adaptor subunit [Methylotenera sp.]